MRGLQRGDPIQTADGIATAGGDDVTAHLRCDEFTRFHTAIATAAEPATPPKMIVETTC
jgi:hypothetical protein